MLVLRFVARELAERLTLPVATAGRAGLAFPEPGACKDARRDAKFGVEA
jgi:hypothetical protein